MKLAKKMLVCLMALVIAAMIGVYAMAATATGDEVEVKLVFTNLAGAKSGNYEISYDASKLEFVKAKKNSLIADDEPRISMSEAGNPEAGLVTYAFAVSDTLQGEGLDSAALLTVTFKAIADGEAAVSVKEVSKDGAYTAALDTTTVVIGEKEVESTTAKEVESTTAKEVESTTAKEVESTTEKKPDAPTTIPQPGDETTTDVIPPVDPDEVIVKEKDFINGKDLCEKDAACEKAADAAKAAKTAKAAKGAKAAVAQTGDTAVALIAGIMAIGAVGFIATKKKEEI